MGEAKAYYMELRYFLYMAACVAAFPLYRRPGTWRSVAWFSTIFCIIISFVSVCHVFVLIWIATLAVPPDRPGLLILRINGCLTGIVQSGALVFLSVFGIRKYGLHNFIVTLKGIRNQNKPRPAKDLRRIIKMLNALAVLHIAVMSIFVLFLNNGFLSSRFSHLYKDLFASFIHSEAHFKIYTFSKLPFEFAAAVGSGLVLYIFMTSVLMVRKEIEIFCQNLEKHQSSLLTSGLFEQVRRDHASLLTLISVTSKIFSPFYSVVTACRLSSAVLIGYNAFYPKFQPLILMHSGYDLVDLIVLTGAAIYLNAGVSFAIIFNSGVVTRMLIQ